MRINSVQEKEQDKHFPHISIVVIGFNEEKNLNSTFHSIMRMNYPEEKIELIYIDSGSSDNSVNVAKQFTGKIFIEDKFPSPGRNRNRGLVEASNEIVHFVDGDVKIDTDYLRNIIPLFEEKKVHAIVGQLNEQNPNFYNKMASLSNAKKKEGYALSTSTGSTYLKSALLSINGYDERIRRGEEIELGERFRKAGYKIWCTQYIMGSHNFGINNLWKYLNKYEINAKSMVQLVFLDGKSEYFLSARTRIKKIIIKSFFFFISLLFTLIFQNIVFVFAYLLIAWFFRNKRFIIKKNQEKANVIIIRVVIDFFFYWKWWLGFIKEFYNYKFVKSSKYFYALKKMELNC